MYDTSVYIGRFQPIHNAHLETIEKALNKSSKLIIFVGSANRVQTIRNPWTFEQRKSIIESAIRDHFDEPHHQGWQDKPPSSVLDNVQILPLRDYMYNDYKWVSEVYSKAINNGATENKGTLLIGCYKDDTSYYLEMFPKWDFEAVPYMWNLDSTDIRDHLFQNEYVDDRNIAESTADFINEWITQGDKSDHLKEEWEYYENYHKKWDKAPYPPTFNTVDIITIKSGCVLLIKRGFHPGKGLWALPGGFLDPSEKIEDGAIRELKEETRINIPKAALQSNLEDMKIFDHPQRSLRGRTITYAHLVDLGHGDLPEVKASTDATGAHWIPLADVYKMEDEFFEDHYDIIINMVSKY